MRPGLLSIAPLSLLAAACMIASVPDPIHQLGIGEPIERGPAPPDHIAISILGTTSGRGRFIYRQGHFTEAQVRDPRWEVRRREKMNQIRMCPSYRIVRREIRWYEATPQSGERCAAIIYTGICASVLDGPDPDLDARRIAALRQDPDPPIEAGCGEKDSARRSDPPRPSDEERRKALLSGEARCLPGEAASARPIRVGPETRFYVRALVNPAFAQVTPEPVRADIAQLLAFALQWPFENIDRIPPQVRSSPVADNGANVLVTVEFAPTGEGRPYCVQVSARQGDRYWRRTIERTGFLENIARVRREVGTTRRGHANDPSRLWSPGLDATLLMDALGAHLLAHAAPDREFRRGWGRGMSRGVVRQRVPRARPYSRFIADES